MTSKPLCNPCSRADESAPAIKFCVDCEDPLCDKCVETHKRMKALMKHQFTDIEAATVVDISTMASMRECSKHQSTIDLYCISHEVLCCRRCMTEEHRSCDQIVPLEDACHNVKKSSMFHDTSKDLGHLQKTLQDFIKDRKQHKKDIDTQKNQIQHDITELKHSLIKQLDEIEKSSFLELDELCHSTVLEIEKTERKAETSKSLVEQYLQQTKVMTENGSKQLIFTFLHHLQPKIKSEFDVLGNIISNISGFNIQYKLNKNILHDAKQICSIEIKKTPCEMKPIKSKDAEAQQVYLLPSQPILSFTYECDFEGVFQFVTAIDLDKDNNVLLADQSYIKMHSQQGKYIKQCQVDGDSWDLSCHKTSGRIVVSLQSAGIQIIDNFIPQLKISVPDITPCLGITFINDNIAVGGRGVISILDFNGRQLSTITTETTRYIEYLHHHQSKLYFTDYTDKVYCIKEDGTRMPTMTLAEIQEAEGVTTDHNGNVYVVGMKSHNIVRVSQDGEDFEVVLKRDEDIIHPFGLCFSKDYKKMFLSSTNCKVIKKFTCIY